MLQIVKDLDQNWLIVLQVNNGSKDNKDAFLSATELNGTVPIKPQALCKLAVTGNEGDLNQLIDAIESKIAIFLCGKP